MVRTFHHREFPAGRLSVERGETVSVVVPTRNCAATIGPIAGTLARLREAGVIDQALVVDADSEDGTARIATEHGVDAVSENALLPEFGPARGKGDAMWRALSVCTGDVVVYVDGDSGAFGEHFVCGTVGPLLLEPGVEYVKAFFRRPFRAEAATLPDGGGRVTELTARPLLRRFWPELAALLQPLAGEMAARRELLWRLPFSTGYAVETALLLDIHREVGAGALAQVDLEVRHNDHKSLPDLAPMADEVLAAATVRLVRAGRLADDGAEPPLERPAMSRVLAAAA